MKYNKRAGSLVIFTNVNIVTWNHVCQPLKNYKQFYRVMVPEFPV